MLQAAPTGRRFFHGTTTWSRRALRTAAT